MFRQRRGVLGTMAQTAIVAGTAQATTRAMNRRWDRKEQEQMAQQQAQAPQGEATPVTPDIGGQLKQLADLKQTGAISESEYMTAKAQLLGTSR